MPGDFQESAAQIRTQLERVLASDFFASSARRVRLLRFLVEETLAGRKESLKESVLAVEVFDRTPDHDPGLDTLVSVEMGRLRSRLIEYYAQAGANDPIRIEVPKGSYAPAFQFLEPAVALLPARPDPLPADTVPVTQPSSRF